MTNPPQGQPSPEEVPQGQHPQNQPPHQQQAPFNQYGQPAQQGQQQWGYPQQHTGYPQGGYPPPTRKRTGLWVGSGIGVVLIAALLITGFAAPGFFLSKNTSSNNAQTPKPSQQNPNPGNGIPGSSPNNPSTGMNPPEGRTDDGYLAVMNGIVEKVNAGDMAGAMALVCPDYQDKLRQKIEKTIARNPKLAIESAGIDVPNFANSYLSGTLNGQELPQETDSEGLTVPKGRVSAYSVGRPWCIGYFSTGIPEIDGS